MSAQVPIILDGPMGTELLARGVPTPLPGWSAHANEAAPEVVREIHRAYAKAGATAHTTNTFRTQPEILGDGWADATRTAVALARESVPEDHLILGSMAPLADCYRPDESPFHTSPLETARVHRSMARCLAESRVDVLLCETFALVEEGLVAVEAALETGLPVWVSFTAGPDSDLLTPAEIVRGARESVQRGVSAVLVNCVPATQIVQFLQPMIAAVGAEARVGAYANAGHVDAGMGWAASAAADGARSYAAEVARWVELGASIVGGCCGTGPEHIAALV